MEFEGWYEVPLPDVVYFQEGPGLRNWQYRDQGIPFVNIRCLKDGRLARSEMTCLDPEEVEEKYKHFLLEAGDFVVSSSGTLGRLAEVFEEDLPCMLNTSVIRFRPLDGDVLDRRFLKAFLRSDLFHSQILVHASGSAQLNYGPTHLKQMILPLPPIEEQRNIGRLLGVLDDRIDNIRSLNHTLEAIAQALFKSWFVDFDPVRAKAEGREPEGMDAATAALFPGGLIDSELGSIPEGWKVDEIGDLVDCLGGGTPSTKNETFWEGGEHHWATPKDLSGLQVPVLSSTARKITDTGVARISSGLLPPGALLMSSRAPIGYLAISAMPTAINQGFIAIPPGGALPPAYLLFWAKANMDLIKQKANGSTFMEISRRAFRPIRVLLPPPEILAAFMATASPILDRIKANERHRATLAEVRDTLLPRVTSGRLRLPEIAGGV